MWFGLIDVGRLEKRCSESRWWSVERFNLVTFRRRDYLAPHDRPLDEAVRDRVERQLGRRPEGPVRMLAHLRQWGMNFNPVAFYFCEDQHGGLDAVLAEVHNTPWNERHAYVLDAADQSGPDYRFRFGKAFHVSPFLPMDMDYDWQFRLEESRIDVHMKVMREGRDCFSAGARLDLAPLDARAMRRMPLRFPVIGARVVVGIYWHAFRLWLKRTPFFPHPGTHEEDQESRHA